MEDIRLCNNHPTKTLLFSHYHGHWTDKIPVQNNNTQKATLWCHVSIHRHNSCMQYVQRHLLQQTWRSGWLFFAWNDDTRLWINHPIRTPTFSHYHEQRRSLTNMIINKKPLCGGMSVFIHLFHLMKSQWRSSICLVQEISKDFFLYKMILKWPKQSPFSRLILSFRDPKEAFNQLTFMPALGCKNV